MRAKTFFYPLFSFVLMLAVTAWGIWANARQPTLENGGHLTRMMAEAGVSLSGWEESAPGQWSFVFTAEDGLEEATLWLNQHARVQGSAQDSDDELFPLTLRPGEPVRLTVLDPDYPLAWLATPARTQRAAQLRQIIQLQTLAALAMMLACIGGLFYYKRQHELRCFLLYLLVLLVWGLLIYLWPGLMYSQYLFLLRLCFAMLVLAQFWLGAALTGSSLGASGNRRRELLLGLAYLALGCVSHSGLRFCVLMAGMLASQWGLARAYRRGVGGTPMLLLGAALTNGMRVWVLLPRLGLPFFRESLPFYIIRCARAYDLPFALGCMFFVCRRFALQFDRTEQLARELDQRVNERTLALTQQTEARKSMMLNIFHDLRSPLFAVSSGLDTLAADPEALPALLPALQERTEFLRRLTEDLFLAAKLEQKQVLLCEEPVALDEAAVQVCAACRPEAEKKGVQLSLDAAGPLPVWGDAVRLQQAIQNLVTNAIHYTPAGGRVEVLCRAGDGAALVSVRDTGCGIAPEEQAAVFERYFHTSRQTKHDSTGLGLTIAKELVELHHGQILLESAPGKGSCFTVRLPLLAEE